MVSSISQFQRVCAGGNSDSQDRGEVTEGAVADRARLKLGGRFCRACSSETQSAAEEHP